MPQYRRKSEIVEAVQWFKDEDHPAVKIREDHGVHPSDVCGHCGHQWPEHGDLEGPEGWCIVCPGNWITPAPGGTHYTYDSDSFAAFYEPVPERDEKAEEALVRELEKAFYYIAVPERERNHPRYQEWSDRYCTDDIAYHEEYGIFSCWLAKEMLKAIHTPEED